MYKNIEKLCYNCLFVVMLCWFVSRDVADAVLAGGRRLQKSDICSGIKTAACLDGNACLNVLQKYCEPQAWQEVQRIADRLQEEAVWYCATCTLAVGETRCIACDSCLQWFHFRCAVLKTVPKAKLWFCRGCKLQ